MTSGERRVAASPSCVACDFGDGLVLLDLEENLYFRLNAVGTLVWRALSPPEGAATPAEALGVDELVARVTQEFDVDEDRCRADLDALLDAMARRRLVRIEDRADHAPAEPH